MFICIAYYCYTQHCAESIANIQTLTSLKRFHLTKVTISAQCLQLGKNFLSTAFYIFSWGFMNKQLIFMAHFPHYRHKLCTFSTLPHSSSQQLCKVKNFYFRFSDNKLKFNWLELSSHGLKSGSDRTGICDESHFRILERYFSELIMYLVCLRQCI